MKDPIVQEYDEYYTDAYNAWNSFYPLAERDLRFYLGDQWDEQEKRKLFEEGRSTFVFNRIRPNINLLTGYQRQNRLSSVVSPRESSDQEAADQLSQLLLYVMSSSGGYQCISDTFAGALKTGWNLMNVWVDYRDDPVNGDIRFCREPYNSFICDPYFTQLDWSDCSYVIKRKYIGPEIAVSLLPNREKEIWELYKSGWARDDKFTWLPYQRMPTGQDMLAYNEFYQQKWKEVPLLVDEETGQYLEFDVPKERQDMILSLHQSLKIVKKPKRYIEKHIIINDHWMKTEINPYGLDEFPFSPSVAIWEPESDQWELKVQSAIRTQVDPQREANRRRSQMVDVLESNINSGWIATEKSVINPKSLFQTGQGKVIWKKEGAEEPRQIPPSQVPPSMFQLQEVFDRDIREVAGINDASFGSPSSGNESGIMMMLRQGAALTGQQDLMDNLRTMQQSISKKVLKIIQGWTPEKMKRILNAEPVPALKNGDTLKYDVVVQEGMLTDTQKQIYFRQLVDLKQLGAPVTGEMLAQAAPIQGKSEYNKQIAAAEQAQAQQAQAQAQVQQELLQSQLEYNKASSIEKMMGAKERNTRASANMSLMDERTSQAIYDRSKATLDQLKAMKELEEMDQDKLLGYIKVIKALEALNKASEEREKADNEPVDVLGGGLPAQSPGIAPEIQEITEVEDETRLQ